MSWYCKVLWFKKGKVIWIYWNGKKKKILDKLKFFQTKTHSKCLVSKTAACCD